MPTMSAITSVTYRNQRSFLQSIALSLLGAIAGSRHIGS